MTTVGRSGGVGHEALMHRDALGMSSTIRSAPLSGVKSHRRAEPAIRKYLRIWLGLCAASKLLLTQCDILDI
jgi:hypothetical protein